ncbi:MAG TPA: SBBP repeat-containing protein [Pyrinomonadaceae bacterium]|nr:SBBP repeat-containing protein [Pyrinomonadaceae bacterium]
MKTVRVLSRPQNLILFIFTTAGILALVVWSTSPRTSVPAIAGHARSEMLTKEQAAENYGRIELSFEANRGQTDDAVNFLARGAGYTLFLKPTEATLRLRNADSGSRNNQDIENSKSVLPSGDSELKVASPSADQNSEIRNQQSTVLRMKLAGANANANVSGEQAAGRVNYFTGNDQSRWNTDIPTYSKVRYTEVYPGIDVVYYGNQRQLEYDFVVAPGRDPQAIKLEFAGADKIEVNGEGELLLSLGASVVRQPKPLIYQEVAGERRIVAGGYTLDSDKAISFVLGDYDASLPLVIDPTLVYSTYLGGSGADQSWAIAVDSVGNSYIAGFTASTNFPTANAVQAANGGFQDAFVTKLNAAGTALVYSTYLGGSGQEQARGLAVDSAGNAYVTGFTGSTNFPTANALQAAQGAGNSQDTFITKLNAAGSALVYSTYLGGDGALEFGEGIAVDSAGNAYVTGVTNSTNFPIANAVQAAHAGGGDVYLTKLNAAGSALVYSTYLGGSGFEIAEDVEVDSSGNAYVTGDTASTNYPTANAVQAASGGGSSDAFVTKVNAAGTALVYSTYLGGSARDAAESVAVDSAGNAYVTGDTESTNFPIANALQPVNDTSAGIAQEVFVTKINAAGSAFVYSTYLGGRGGDLATGIVVDSTGNAYIAGGTGSVNSYPTANAIQCTRNGGSDAFITKINAAGTALIYSTYLGGSGTGGQEFARGIAIDSAGNAYVAGGTNSTDFPTVTPIQSTFAGGDGLAGDAFVLKLSDTSAGPASLLQFTQTAPVVQEDVTSFTLTVQRTGDTSGAVTVDYATTNGTASERSDYTTAVGTLRFGIGETSKTIDILVNEDSFVEGNENFTVTLSNPTGGATLSCLTAVATIQITDDAVEPTSNVIDDSTIFVGQHYHDFLNRQADAGGLAFWVSQIENCGADAQCREVKRIDVSAAFFLSIEFQETGFEVIRIYRASFTDTLARPRALPRYREFLRDTQEIQRGVIVGMGNWEQQLNDNRINFARAWVQRADFIAEFPLGMNTDAYINKLFANSGVTPTAAEFSIAFDAYGAGDVQGRAQALLAVIGSSSVYNAQFNPAFVLMQYIGYLRRNPNDAPEPALNYAGYDYWLAKMNQFSVAGEDVQNEQVALRRIRRAEMVRAFIISFEYRGRFGP